MTSILIPQKLLEPWAPDNAWALVIRKEAEPNPLTEEGFLHYEARLVQDLIDATQGPADVLRNAFENVIENLSLSLLGRMRLNRSINKALKVFADSLLEVTPGIAADHMLSIADDAVSHHRGSSMVSKSVQKSDAEPLFERHFLLNSNAMFHGAYLRDTMPKLAQKIVTQAHIDNKHLEHDERIKATAQALKEGLGKLPNQTDRYWRTFAANGLNNARTYALLNEYDSAENVIAYRIISIKDSKTTNICRTLHGRVFPIKKALKKLNQFFNATSLSEVSAISPMVQGNQSTGFYYPDGEKRVDVDPQNYSKLVSSGISFPPFHHNCRTTIKPVYGSVPEGKKLRESAKDFEDNVLNYEYSYHRDILNQMSDGFRDAYGIQDAQVRANKLNALAHSFRAKVEEFNHVWNYSALTEEFDRHFQHVLSGSYDDATNVRARLLDLQGAYYARAQKHQILGFQFPTAKRTNQGKKRGWQWTGIDMDVLSFDGEAICSWQMKFGKEQKRKKNYRALYSLRDQTEKHFPFMQSSDIFKYTDPKSKAPHMENSKELFSKINNYFDGKIPKKRRIIGATNRIASEGKPLFDDIIKRGIRRYPDVSVTFIQDIDDLKSKSETIIGGSR